MQKLLDVDNAMTVRRRTVDHTFGTIKSWIGYTHFLTRCIERMKAEMSLCVLAYNIKRMISIMGVQPSSLRCAVRPTNRSHRPNVCCAGRSLATGCCAHVRRIHTNSSWAAFSAKRKFIGTDVSFRRSNGTTTPSAASSASALGSAHECLMAGKNLNISERSANR